MPICSRVEYIRKANANAAIAPQKSFSVGPHFLRLPTVLHVHAVPKPASRNGLRLGKYIYLSAIDCPPTWTMPRTGMSVTTKYPQTESHTFRFLRYTRHAAVIPIK